MDPIIALKIVERELAKLRFHSMDQNPKGIRDLLSSAIRKLEQERHRQHVEMNARHEGADEL